MKRKVLICGASGFIGRNIAEMFAEENDFEAYGVYLQSGPLCHPRINAIKADLTKKEDVARVIEGMDIVIQAAATTSGAKDIVTKPYYHVTDNAVMNSLIVRAAYEYKVSHVVFFSCTVMYHSSDTLLKEADFNANEEMHPKYFGVGWTKVYLEKMCEFYSRLGHTKYTAIRHSNIYGPYDKFDLERSHVLAATITKVMSANNGGKIKIWGTGEERRDLLYVSDLVNFVKLAVNNQKSPFELFNVGFGKSISIKELVEKVIVLSGKEIEVEYEASKPTIKTIVSIDSSKANLAFGWRPQVSLKDGIKKTMGWYEDKFRNRVYNQTF
jgi:nucleoside-diphosphate-sugar epimerase